MLGKVVVATIVFALIQLLTSVKANLFAAVVANIPVFTIFAFLSVESGQDVRKMAFYLFAMTLCISLGYLVVFAVNVPTKQSAVLVFSLVWVALTITAYITLRRFL